jgi:heme exporter protein A
MASVTLRSDSLTKLFSRRVIFSGVSFEVSSSEVMAVTGRNGSGKSTLMKMIAGVLSPTKGTVALAIDGKTVSPEDRFRHIGFVAPYLNLYDEFTGTENLKFFRDVRSSTATDEELAGLLDLVNLSLRKNDDVRTYSSGMKQRLKYAFALLHKPPVLLLDEPRSNLDTEGIATVYSIIKRQKEHGIVIIATNDAEDLSHCSREVNLDALQRPERGGKR